MSLFYTQNAQQIPGYKNVISNVGNVFLICKKLYMLFLRQLRFSDGNLSRNGERLGT